MSALYLLPPFILAAPMVVLIRIPKTEARSRAFYLLAGMALGYSAALILLSGVLL